MTTNSSGVVRPGWDAARQQHGDVLAPYLKLIAARIAHIMPPQQFVAELMRATEMMLANDGQVTNEELSPALLPGRSAARAPRWSRSSRVLRRGFPEAAAVHAAQAEARRVVQRVFDLGYDVAVTTNPLFPATAVMQRLAWRTSTISPTGW